ncbi:MAG: hypothetical protein ACHQJ6_08085 [Candidatus Berkiellales bacterium]
MATKLKLIKRKDEIFVKHPECGHQVLIAYWDEEIESYIYFAKEPYSCRQCEPLNTFDQATPLKGLAKNQN